MTHLSRDRFLRIALWPLAGVALLVLFQGAASRGSEPRESRTAQPASVSTDFAMKQLNGEPLRLSDYHGKVIMVDFWASWCPPCREEIPHFVEWQKQYGGEGLQVIGIAMDDYPADAVKAARELGIDPGRSFAVGDRWLDVALAREVGAAGVLVRTGYGLTEEQRPVSGLAADAVVDNLAAAASWILRHRRS